jgi:DNA-binding transcriptional regulator YiaG
MKMKMKTEIKGKKMGRRTKDERFTDITDEVDEILNREDIAASVARYREERLAADRAHAMGLAAVRKAFNLTQVELARSLGVSQAAVTKLERQDDMLLSTFCSYMGALHGRVRILVDFDGEHEIEVELAPVVRRFLDHSDA